MDRKHFIKTLAVLGITPQLSFSKKGSNSPIRFGVISDLHYADRPPRGSRYFKDSLNKLGNYVEEMNRLNPDFILQLGDFKDEDEFPNPQATIQYLKDMEKEYSKYQGERFHALGNHDHDSISKEEFIDHTKNSGKAKGKAYYSFSKGHCHFIVLDANYKKDGQAYNKGNFDWKDCHVPQHQIEWLKQEVKSTEDKVIVVFIHQRLDDTFSNPIYCPNNAAQVRAILETNKNTKLVIQGHDHKGGFCTINGIYYWTVKGAVEGAGKENNSFSLFEISKSHIKIKGFFNAESNILDI